MKKYLVFIVVLIVIGQAHRLVAMLANEPYRPINSHLEGAKILFMRMSHTLLSPPASEKGIYFAGSSRTMSFYNPLIFQENDRRLCPQSHRVFFNLGNIANDLSELHKAADKIPTPSTLILEYSPLMLLENEGQSPTPAANSYRQYRQYVSALELYISGAMRALFFVGDAPNLSLKLIKKIKSAHLENRLSLKSFYYLLRESTGYGQIAESHGLVTYRNYLANSSAGLILKQVLGTDPENYQDMLRRPFSQQKWQSYQALIMHLQKRGIRPIVIRPLIDQTLFALEQELTDAQTSEVVKWLAKNSITYLDTNHAHSYSYADRSHIDWFDNVTANQVVAPLILRNLPCPGI